MEALALIGVSQRRGGTEALEAWTAWVEGVERWPQAWVQEVVPITTCNRCDLVLALPRGVSLERLRSELIPAGLPRGYAFAGEAAFEQLCRVAASLDSLNPGEDQIMNQVRSAFEAARSKGTVGPTTSLAFNLALRIAKRVRREVPLAPEKTSLFSLARPVFERSLPARAKVAVLGAGEMGALAARSLAANAQISLLIANRSLDRARALAAELHAEALELGVFLTGEIPVDGLVCATPVEHLIGEDFLARQPRLRAIVDLGLPRNIDPRLAAKRGLVLIDLERMQALGEERRKQLQVHLARAEAIIQEELEAALAEWAERRLGMAIAQLRERYRATLEGLLGELLPPEEIHRLAGRFAHLPIKGLRGLVRSHGLEAAQVFLDEAGLGQGVERV
ncbi:glutamyl-tRNA reductase [Allomeiothermus silvanus]|uniref:glutamyl-tRNA reductase n=1 Tax=Allomeiothermus silvanus TaxID=52022 RepID=UPI0023F0F053|nr:glutamyl-tRNA reductase [Allomeiothermus silvanus]